MMLWTQSQASVLFHVRWHFLLIISLHLGRKGRNQNILKKRQRKEKNKPQKTYEVLGDLKEYNKKKKEYEH